MPRPRTLCVGLVCADFINICHSFPEEDSDQRVADQMWHRGGNASNTCTVLSVLGVPCEFLGTIAKAPEMSFIVDDFNKYGIHIENCVYVSNCNTPLSTVIINKQNGSRTILHSRKNLPEVSLEDFKEVDFYNNKYQWVHFEGRQNVCAIKAMMHHLEDYNKRLDDAKKHITISVELEKRQPELEELLALADYVFISRDHAEFTGYQSMGEAVDNFIQRCKKGATVICTWGSKGATAKTSDGETFTAAAFPPERIVDTLGAGDTFIAATITALSAGSSVEQSLVLGCRVAGAKCGQQGFDQLQKWCQDNL